MTWLVPLPVVIPLVAAGLTLALGRRSRLQAIISALAITLVVLASGALMFLAHHEGPQVVNVGEWSAPVGISLVADRLSALMLLVSGVVLLCVVFGWKVGLLAAVIHVNYYLAGSAAVNAIGHHFGRRRYPNSATNLQWLAFLTAGEGLHNNHHAAPTSAKLAHRWYEIDLGWLVIKPLTWLRLARVRLNELRLAPSARREMPVEAA